MHIISLLLGLVIHANHLDHLASVEVFISVHIILLLLGLLVIYAYHLTAVGVRGHLCISSCFCWGCLYYAYHLATFVVGGHPCISCCCCCGWWSSKEHAFSKETLRFFSSCVSKSCSFKNVTEKTNDTTLAWWAQITCGLAQFALVASCFTITAWPVAIVFFETPCMQHAHAQWSLTFSTLSRENNMKPIGSTKHPEMFDFINIMSPLKVKFIGILSIVGINNHLYWHLWDNWQWWFETALKTAWCAGHASLPLGIPSTS